MSTTGPEACHRHEVTKTYRFASPRVRRGRSTLRLTPSGTHVYDVGYQTRSSRVKSPQTARPGAGAPSVFRSTERQARARPAGARTCPFHHRQRLLQTRDAWTRNGDAEEARVAAASSRGAPRDGARVV